MSALQPNQQTCAASRPPARDPEVLAGRAGPHAGRPARVCAALALMLVLGGCAHSTGTGRPAASGGSTSQGVPASAGETGITLLQEQLTALDATVATNEAQRVAAIAYDLSRKLARDYRLLRPPLFHNFLVNLGLKKRGLCYHWAEDLLAELQTLQLSTLQLRWGIARAGSLREHNCVVVTAKGQPFERGIVLDGWRHSGRLFWTRVTADRYPWEEGELGPPRGG